MSADAGPAAGPAGAAAGRAPSVTGMRLVLFTDRYPEAVALLRDGLGLPVAPGGRGDSRDATVFAAGPARIEVVAEERRIGSGVGLRLDVDDLDAVAERLTNHGLRPLGPVGLPWGERVCGVGGPGGLLVELVEGAGRRPTPPPRRRVPDHAVVTCVDVGDDPLAPLGLAPGAAHVITTSGGVVTTDTVRDLAMARDRLGVRRVTVVHHEPCAFLAPGPLPAVRAPDREERLRASLARLTRPPLSLSADAVTGLLRGPGGALVRVDLPA